MVPLDTNYILLATMCMSVLLDYFGDEETKTDKEALKETADRRKKAKYASNFKWIFYFLLILIQQASPFSFLVGKFKNISHCEADNSFQRQHPFKYEQKQNNQDLKY